MSATHPTATVTLPDGQAITVNVLARRRNTAGQWWYECEIELYERVDQQPDQPSIASPYPVAFWAPYPLVQPIEGQGYDQLKAPTVVTATAEWGVEAAATAGGLLRIHVRGCWEANPGLTEPITAARAQALLRDRQAVHCGCDADRLRS
jgi:hypothetical protein